MPRPVLRFAPSPNGHLHLGHAYSALLNDRMAHDLGGRFLVRIEDTDQSRCSRQLTADLLDDLAWLGLKWEEPVRIQSEHMADYNSALLRLWDMDAIYPCFCSRKDASRLPSSDPDGQPHYAGTCRSISRTEAQERLSVEQQHGWRLDMSNFPDTEAAPWGDVTIAKPKVGSSYHIAVVVDDALQGVTHVVRGKDIEAATPIHKLLQKLLGLQTPQYHHHELILDDVGAKLAKSRRSVSLRDLRNLGLDANDVRRQLGFEPT